MLKGKHLRFASRRRPSCCFSTHSCHMQIVGSVNPVFCVVALNLWKKFAETGQVGRSQKGFLLH